MSEEEFAKLVEEIPSVIDKNPISSYYSINVDDLRKAVFRLNKIPNYNDLLKENHQLQEKLDKINEMHNAQ